MSQLEDRARVPGSRTSAAPVDGSAPSVVEYAIIVVMIAAVAVGTWKTFGEPPQPDPIGESSSP